MRSNIANPPDTDHVLRPRDRTCRGRGNH